VIIKAITKGVANSVNSGIRICQKLSETCTIGSSIYKNLKLKKKKEEKGESGA
jgi:hypothetical protein